MSDDDLRTLLREVGGELDHARVLRTVHARRGPSRWAPLAAAAAVACVLLASVGTLAWVTSRDEAAPVRPAASPLPDPEALVARARAAFSGDDVACSRVRQDGRVVLEQLRTGVAFRVGSSADPAWPGCGPGRARTVDGRDRLSEAATQPPSYDLKVAATRDLLAPLADPSAPATVAGGADGTTVLRVDTARLRYEYGLDAAGRPGSVLVRLRGGGAAEVSATVVWFGPGTAQAEALSGR